MSDLSTSSEALSGITESPSVAANLAVRLRHLRAERGWSLETLARRSGVSRSRLSEIERSQANPTLAVAVSIAGAFDLSLAELLENSAMRPARLVPVRAHDPATVYRDDAACRVRTLSPLAADRVVEVYEVSLGPCGELRSEPHFTGTREHVTVRTGRVRIESGAETADLARGDSLEYPADVRHAIVNAGRGSAVVILIDVFAPRR